MQLNRKEITLIIIINHRLLFNTIQYSIRVFILTLCIIVHINGQIRLFQLS